MAARTETPKTVQDCKKVYDLGTEALERCLEAISLMEELLEVEEE